MLGTKLLFSTTAHPQTDGQTEVINRTLGTLLKTLVKKNKKFWEECVPIAEFAYNRTSHSTIQHSPFYVVYGFEPLTPLDLCALPSSEFCDIDGEKKASKIKELHEEVRQNIMKANEHNARIVNKHRKEIIFEPGDWVWLHMRKIRFPNKVKSKLDARGDGPFQVLERLNNNAYRLDLPSEFSSVHGTFNVADLSPYEFQDARDLQDADSRTNPFQEGGSDINVQAKTQAHDPLMKMQGPLTRLARKKRDAALKTLLVESMHKEEALFQAKEELKWITILKVEGIEEMEHKNQLGKESATKKC